MHRVQGPCQNHAGEADRRRVKAERDAQLHVDLNTDAVELQPEMYHILFFV